MGNRSRLSDAQRREAVELFRQGYAVALAAKKMGVDRRWLKSLYGRWRVVGDGVLSVDRRRPKTYTFEVKLEVVRRYMGFFVNRSTFIHLLFAERKSKDA